jgi:hypothetical protein
MTVEYAAVAVSTAAVAVALVWSTARIRGQMRAIDARFAKMQKDIDQLQMQESRRMLMEMRTNSTAEALPIDPGNRPAEVDSGDVVEVMKTPATTP